METIAHKKLFVKIPVEFAQYGYLTFLRPKELAVYLALKQFENSVTHVCFPSYKTINRITRVSKSNVRHILTKLELFQLIDELKSTPQDPHKYNKYFIRPNIHPINAWALDELRKVAADIKKKRAERWRTRKQMLPRLYATRVAHSSQKVKGILAKVLAQIPQQTKPT